MHTYEYSYTYSSDVFSQVYLNESKKINIAILNISILIRFLSRLDNTAKETYKYNFVNYFSILVAEVVVEASEN